MEEKKPIKKWRKLSKHTKTIASAYASYCAINTLDDGCLMHIFSFLSPIPDRYNTALVCHRWHFLACHPRLWLRVDRSIKEFEPGVFPNIEAAVSAARPGDTILIAPGGIHLTSNIQIKKTLCLVCTPHLNYAPVCTIVSPVPPKSSTGILEEIGGGELPEETTLTCSQGSDSALEFLSSCKISNLTVKTELGCCLLHRSGRLIIDDCVLQCESHSLDYLSYPIVSTGTAVNPKLPAPTSVKGQNGVTVSRTRIEGGAKAVSTSGSLRRVRVIYARTSIFFWFDVEH